MRNTFGRIVWFGPEAGDPTIFAESAGLVISIIGVVVIAAGLIGYWVALKPKKKRKKKLTQSEKGDLMLQEIIRKAPKYLPDAKDRKKNKFKKGIDILSSEWHRQQYGE